MRFIRQRRADRVVGALLGMGALAPLVVVVGLLSYLVESSWPVWRMMGWHFFTGQLWNLGNLYAARPAIVHGVPVMPGASFGALVFILGTALTSFMALALAVPLGFFVAAASGYFVHGRWRVVMAGLVEMMAGIPSVIFGLWGLMVVAPAWAHHVGPLLNRVLHHLPFFTGPVQSETNLTVAVVVITLMIVPIIAATIRAVMERVPRELVESGLALGWTEAETFWRLVWPYARSAVIGGAILGLGRALGETMAVLMVSGDALNVLPRNIYSSISTMAATIAGQLDAALTDPTKMAIHALGALGLVLFAATFVVNILARVIVNRSTAQLRAVTKNG